MPMQQFLRHIATQVQPNPLGLLAAAVENRGVPVPLPATDRPPGLEFEISEDLRRLLDLPLNPRPDTPQTAETTEIAEFPDTVRTAAQADPQRRAPPVAARLPAPAFADLFAEPLGERSRLPDDHGTDIAVWQPPRMPETERAAPTGVPLMQPAVPVAPRIGNRAQALQALRAFEADRFARLPQLAPDRPAADRSGLSLGLVRFGQAADLLTTFPCATQVNAPDGSPPGVPFAMGAVVYPRGQHFLSVPRKAFLLDPDTGGTGGRGMQEVAVARNPVDRRHVHFSTDLRQWQPTDIYTDSLVEAEKLAMWTRIFTEAYRLAQDLTPDAPLPDR